MLNLNRILTCAGVAAGSAVAIFAAPAHAVSVSFAPFNFTTNWTGAPPKGDVLLQSVTMQNGSVIDDFEYVSGANIIQNDTWNGGNTGAASSDKGDNASGINLETATNASVVASLGNNNLNNIIDTEDTGSFTMDVFFSQAVNRFFLWERGMNSKLTVQALDAGGNVLSSFLFNSALSKSAGFDIDTTEITQKQAVGSLGLRLHGTQTNRLRLISTSRFNGPDFKVVAAAPVPEPATIAGTVMAAGAVVAARRKKQQKQAEQA